jgi:nucleoside-diphosphate-sugar epimerase
VITIGITSVGSGVSQSVLRSLAVSDLDHRVVGLDAGAYASGVYWVDAAYLVPRVTDVDAYRARVIEIVELERIDMLIPGLDPELIVLATMREELGRLGCTVLVSEPEVVRLSTDKLATADWSTRLGLPFVPTRTLADAQAHAEELEYPVIVKPRTGSSSEGIRLAHDPAELCAEAGDDQTVVQPYLVPRTRDLAPVGATGNKIEQLHEISAQFLIGPDGHLMGSFVSMNHLRHGVPIQIEPVIDAEWVNDGAPVVDALIALGARGPINLQGRLGADGRVQFFELNARFTGITGIRAMMGFQEVEAVVRAFALDDAEGAARALALDPRLIGLRHVGDMVVPAARVAHLTSHGSLRATRPTSARRILISGASSYVGRSALAAVLAGDAEEVHALVRSQSSAADVAATHPDARLQVHRIDLLEPGLELPPADVVLHLAALRESDDSSSLYEVNVEGTRRLLRAASAAGVSRFAYLSSQSVYGVSRTPPWGESLPPRPETPYATSKWLGEEMCRENVVEGMQLVVLRAARAFGLAPGLRWEELPHQFARKTATGEVLTIHGDGNQRVDLLHVRDLADALVRTAGADLPGPRRLVLNVGSGHPTSLLELAAICAQVAKELGLAAPAVDQVPLVSPAPSFGMHIRRARALLGWSPSTSLSDAIRELAEASHA